MGRGFWIRMPIGEASETGPDRQNGLALPVRRTAHVAAAKVSSAGVGENPNFALLGVEVDPGRGPVLDQSMFGLL